MDLNQIQNLQAWLRDNMLAPNSFDTISDLRAKHSSFMVGGEVTTVMTPVASYVWIQDSTDTDDGDATIKPSDLATTEPGRWKKVIAQTAGGRDCLHFGAAGIDSSLSMVASGDTGSIGDGNNIFFRAVAAGTIAHLYANASNAPGSGKSFNFRVTINGVPAGPTVSIADTAADADDDIGVDFVAGDKIGVNNTATGGPAAADGTVDLGILYDA
jgi:hypothetical protein